MDQTIKIGDLVFWKNFEDVFKVLDIKDGQVGISILNNDTITYLDPSEVTKLSKH